MRSILWPLILLNSLLTSLLMGCASQPTNDYSDSGLDLNSFEGYSEALEQSMLAKDTSLFFGQLDADQFARRSLASLGLAAAKDTTVKSYTDVLGKVLDQRFKDAFSTVKSASFVRLLPNEASQTNEAVALFRFEPEEGGISYWKVNLRRANGHVTVVDWINYSLGDMASHSIGEFSLHVGVALRNPESDDAKAITAYLAAVKSGDPQQLLDNYAQLPTNIKNNSLLMFGYLQAASQISDEVYQAVLSELAPLYEKNDNYALMLVDYYLTIEEYDKAHQALDTMATILGGDAGLDSLHAAIALETNEYKRAIAFASDGIRREPAYENNYWVLLDALVYSKNHADAILVMNILEEGFGYQFDAHQMATLEGYGTFAQSADFMGWRTTSSQ